MGKLRRTRYPRQREQQSKNWTRRQLIRRDGMICGLCQEPIDKIADITLDHIQPVSKGGTDKLENLRLAHEGCNRERGAGFFDEGNAS